MSGACRKRSVAGAGVPLWLIVVISAGCATTGGLTRRDVLNQYDQVAELNERISAARATDGEVLAPEGLQRAQAALDSAVEEAQRGKKQQAQQAAKRGLTEISKVETSMGTAREVMAEVLATRERARQEGAAALSPADFDGADQSLRAATALIERGDVQGAKERRPELLEAYGQLELQAMKQGAAASAEQAIKRARDRGADDYAPRTLANAEQELVLVISVLDADRRQTDVASEHAKRAIWLARRAEAITELAREFDRQEYNFEDMILWHQRQLESVGEPLNASLPFDESDEAAAQRLRSSIDGLVVALADLRAMHRSEQAANRAAVDQLKQEMEQRRKAHEQQLSKAVAELQKEGAAKLGELQQALSEEARQRQLMEREQQERAARFAFAEAAFSPEQAKVLRQGDNLTLQVHGFDFAPGKADVDARNFALLNKIVMVIDKFPRSSIVVSGHTDARGGADRNLRLSIDRAKNVGTFLVEVGKIPAARVRTEGHGETKPVASNETAEGRAQNRRIEVSITNP